MFLMLLEFGNLILFGGLFLKVFLSFLWWIDYCSLFLYDENVIVNSYLNILGCYDEIFFFFWEYEVFLVIISIFRYLLWYVLIL